MKTAHRPATLSDAKRLFEIRRNAIVALAPKGMSAAQVEIWATNLTVAGMEKKIRDLEIWIVQLNGAIVAWGAIRDDRLEGLYTAPEFAGGGIGTELLGMLEGLLRQRGISAVHTEASANAEEFYLRRGYEPIGPLNAREGRPMTKHLS
jgi:putative acetyltransferase